VFDFARFHKAVVERLILGKTTHFPDNPLTLCGQSDDFARFFVCPYQCLFLDQSSRSKLAKVVVYGPFVAGVGEPFEILNVHGPKGANVGHRLNFTVAEGIWSATVVALDPATSGAGNRILLSRLELLGLIGRRVIGRAPTDRNARAGLHLGAFVRLVAVLEVAPTITLEKVPAGHSYRLSVRNGGRPSWPSACN